MGWSASYRKPGETMTKTLIDQGFLRWNPAQNAPFEMTVLASAFVSLSEHYAAVEQLNTVTGERFVFCTIHKIGLFKEDAHGHNFTVKGIGSYDSMYLNCPERILSLLSPAKDQRDIEWREACRARAASRKTISLSAGTEFYLKNPIRFNNGVRDDSFLVIGSKGSALICMMQNNGYKCRVSRSLLTDLHAKQEFSLTRFPKAADLTQTNADIGDGLPNQKPHVNSLKL